LKGKILQFLCFDFDFSDASPVQATEKSILLTTKTPAKRDSPVPEVLSVTAAHHVCTQVLQLLHILFENISQDTSLYFLLSNNFINQIIECVFDLSDDEVSVWLMYVSALWNCGNVFWFWFFCRF
jgi:Uncharacterised conserved protein